MITATETIQIAQTIKEQIGFRRLASIGAKQFTAMTCGGLRFKASLFGAKNCLVTIILDPSDTYTLALYNPSATKKLAEFKDIYADHIGQDVEDLVEGFFKSKK